MKSYIFGVLLFVTYCQALPKTNSSFLREDGETMFDKKLREFLDKFKHQMQTGVPMMNNQTLDPLKINHAEFSLQQPNLVSLAGKIDDFLLKKLSDYNVKSAKFNMEGLKVSVGVEWPALNLNTKYRGNGILADQFPVFGEGTVSLKVEKLYVEISVYIRLVEEHVALEIEKLMLDLKTFAISITGLYNDEYVSELLSTVISDLVPSMVQNYQEDITAYLKTMLETAANDKLENISFEDILEIISL